MVEGPLDPSQFTWITRGRIVRPGLELSAGIIGASHVLVLRPQGRPALHEVFACRDVRAPASARHWCAARPAGLATGLPERFSLGLKGGIDYRFGARRESADAARNALADLEARVAGAASRRGQIGLSFRFPESASGAWRRAGARTLVWMELCDEGRVRAETAHCYPNEGVVVFSQTRVEVASLAHLADASAVGTAAS